MFVIFFATNEPERKGRLIISIKRRDEMGLKPIIKIQSTMYITLKLMDIIKIRFEKDFVSIDFFAIINKKKKDIE